MRAWAMRGRSWMAGVLVMVAALIAASCAQATVIYAHGNDLWEMNDNGTGAKLLVSAADIPAMATLGAPNVLPGGSTVAFDATTNEFQNDANDGDCGLNCEGVYTITNGVVTRNSGAPGDTTDFTSEEYDPSLTANGNVIFDFITVDFAGTPPSATGGTQSIDVRPVAPGGQTASPWSTEPSASDDLLAANPANASLLAYFTDFGGSPPRELYVGDQSNSPAPTAVVSDPWEVSLAWNPAGTGFAVVDDQQPGQSDGVFSPGIWTFPDTAGATPTEVLADPDPSPRLGSPGAFNGGITFAGSEILFTATVNGARNLWEVPSSCTATTCSFPGSATQLTSDGTDSDPTWTSAAIPVLGNPQTLTVALAGSGSGSVSSSPAGISCGSVCSATFAGGTPVTLTATPSTGSSFSGWSGDGCGGTGDCLVTVSAASTVTATFSKGTTGSPGSGGTGGGSGAPAITKLKLVKGRVVASKGFSIKATLAAAATVRITVTEVISKHHHKQVKTIGTINEKGKRGPNTFVIKLVGHHKLKPGTYTLTVVTVRGSHTSKAHQLTLKVVR
jgi:hypothetical protein